jgi:hypothetical protein
MIELWHKLIHKPTFISVISMLMIIISIPIGIYNYITSVPSTEGWVLTFILFLYIGFGILYSIDRLLVNLINPMKLTFVEVVMTIICYFLLNYSSRQLEIDLRNSKQDFVIVVENPGQFTNTQFTTKSFFDKEINSNENIIVVDKIPSKIDLYQRPITWNGSHYYNVYSYDKYKKVVLFSNPQLNINEHISEIFIDSIITKSNKKLLLK